MSAPTPASVLKAVIPETEATVTALTAPTRGMQILFDGNKLARVPDDIVERFQPGDRLLVTQAGVVLHIPVAVADLAGEAVGLARAAFSALAAVDDAAITDFYRRFAARLADDAVWAEIAEANEQDVRAARERGHATTRLTADQRMRREMIRGLEAWQAMPSLRLAPGGAVTHEGWTLDQVIDGLGVIGFVFEGRPNVFADATGILRGGNTAVLRIGSDALGTARTIAHEALRPALLAAGLPEHAITLLDSAERAAGWALFADRRLSLAVARGSGPAVTMLGEIARQVGTPVSQHGTGGAWLIADERADTARFHAALFHSVDRKVCNTVNVVLIDQARTSDLVPAALAALRERGETLGHGYKLHVLDSARTHIPADLFHTPTPLRRSALIEAEPIAAPLHLADLGREWEWEFTPEVSLGLVRNLDEAILLFNTYSPRFVASLISESPEAHDRFFRAVDAPFVGDGFTRWVDGQYALDRPELGLSNWQFGRLFGRGGILSGDGVFTVRMRMRQGDVRLHR
jgi:glutamate-5-semialdehyde dehydrogenase